MYLKQRLFGLALLLGGIVMVYLGWHDLRTEGEYSLKMAALSPLISVGGIFLIFFPTMGGKPESTKHKVILMAVFVVGIVAGLINWFLMDPGFFGF